MSSTIPSHALFIGPALVCSLFIFAMPQRRCLRSLRILFGPVAVSYICFLMLTSLGYVSQDSNQWFGEPFPNSSTSLDNAADLSSSPGESNMLILAAVPRGPQHMAALWSQLECLTPGIKHVVIAAPSWARDALIEPIVERARHMLMPRQIRVDTAFLSENLRYDVGLWCAALEEYGNSTSKADSVTLINDSVHAIRTLAINRTMDTLDYLQSHRNVSLHVVSLNYHDYRDDTPVWLESILRTFTPEGIQRFQQNICQPKFRCHPRMGAQGYKRCVVVNYEVGLIDRLESSHNRSVGLYPALPDTRDPKYRNHRVVRGWSAGNRDWWQELVDTYDFPLQKVAMAGDSFPENCTGQLDTDWLKSLNYSMPTQCFGKKCDY